MRRPEAGIPDDATTSVNPRSRSWYVRRGTGDFTSSGRRPDGSRPPDGLDIAFTDNPSLKPERSRSVEVGLDQAFAEGRGLIEITGFSSEYDDLIVAVGSFNSSSRYRTDNISNARARGIEVSGTARTRFEATVPVDLQLRGSYTWLDTEILAVDRTNRQLAAVRGRGPPFAAAAAQFSVDATARAGRLTAYVREGPRPALDVEPSRGTFGGLFQSAGYVVVAGRSGVAGASRFRTVRSRRQHLQSDVPKSRWGPRARTRGDRRSPYCCRPLTSASVPDKPRRRRETGPEWRHPRGAGGPRRRHPRAKRFRQDDAVADPERDAAAARRSRVA